MTSLNTSPWIPDGPIKKRESTIRRPIAKAEPAPETIEETEQNNKEISSRVTQLLSKLSTDNDGNKLADYEPNYRPEITVNKSDAADTSPPVVEKMTPRYSANDINLANLSNYNQTYTAPTVFQGAQPYYAKMGLSSAGDDKLTEKINYMIHLLEQQQMEKTSNVTEEFILYILLGVFVIFTVDSFTRAGKYVR